MSDSHAHELTALRQQVERHRQALLSSLLVAAWMVEARDPYTGGHLWRVAQMANAVARALGATAQEAHRIAMAGFLHDLGKVGIPDAILRKTGPLTDEEYATIKTHPSVGARMLEGHPLAPWVLGVIHHHHEMPSGRGYPLGLRDTEIPFDARVVGVCDAFDAMTSTRPYRKGMPIATALDRIESALGQQFDATIGATFVAMGRAGAFDAVVGHSDHGRRLQDCPACGPTLVQPRQAQAGQHLGCPACAARFTWTSTEAGLVAQPTGEVASAAELEPALDRAQIAALASEWVAATAAA